MTTTIDASCQVVTTRQDGSPLAQPIAVYRFQYFENNNLPGNVQSVDVPAGAAVGGIVSVQITGLANGPIGCRVLAIDTDGNQGQPTPWVNGDTSDLPPAQPTGFTVDFTRD